MLVEYTPISYLSSGELAALKGAVTGIRLEGRGSHFNFQGKVLAMSELRQYQQVWEREKSAGPSSMLLG